jgi:hypothetical protein
METLAALQTRRAQVYEAYSKALTAQEHQIGSGGSSRRLVRVDFQALADELKALDKLIAAHPETVAATAPAARRRVFYTR